MKTQLSKSKAITLAILAMTLLAGSSPGALYDDFFLNTSGNAVWDQDLNWSTTTYPNNGHTRPDPNGDPIPGPNPTYNAILEIPQLCTLSTGITIEGMTIATGAGLNITSNGVLQLNGLLSNNGTIQMTSSDPVAALVLNNGARIEPGGVVAMGANINNQIYAIHHGDSLTIAPNAVIHGSGQLNIGFFGDTRHLLKFSNQGVIQADQAAVPLYVGIDDSVNAGMTNVGALQAQNGATLVLRTFSSTGTIQGTGGFIQAFSDSSVRIDSGVTVDGGTLLAEGTGAIRATGGGGTLKNVTNSGNVIVDATETLGLAGEIVNNGTIRLEGTSSSSATDLILREDTTLAGNGKITMTDSNRNGFFASLTGLTLTIGAEATIEGAGSLWAYQGGNQFPFSIVNNGLINGNRAENPLVVYLTDNTSIMENTGVLRASDGGTLALVTNSSSGTLNNAGAVIEALADSTVSVGSGVTIEGGTLSTSGNGVVRGAGGGFSNVTNTGTMIASDAASFYVGNTLTNNGILRVEGGYGVVNGDVTLAGTGSLVMSGGGFFSASGPGHTITIGAGMTIEGWGTLGVYLGGNQQPLNYVNHGIIEANDPAHPFNIFSAGAVPTFPNTGTLRASNGASLQFIGNGNAVALTNEGGTIEVLANSAINTQNFSLAQNSGTIDLQNGMMSVPSGLDLNGGELIGNGTFTGAIRNNGGTVSPGHSAGKLIVSGNYTQGPNGTLNVEIGGPIAGAEYDQLEVSGTAALDGTLNIALVDGFRPEIGDIFQIITNANYSGNFSSIHFTGFTGQVNYNAGAVTVTVLTVPDIPLNISTRLGVSVDPNQLIGGIIVTGSQPKNVLIRAIGPSLSAFLTGALADPTLELYQGNTLLESNNNWRDTNQAAIEATGLAPTNDLESAIVRTLAPGAYTAIVRGVGGGNGIGLVEVYDFDNSARSKLANISTRGFVERGDNAMIGGFIMGGNGGENGRVVIRAIGPSLSGFGVDGALGDPVLELHDANGSTLMSNDDWQSSQQAEIEATGLAPTDSHESAIVTSLLSGNYTAIVRGKNDTTGVAVVEVYNIL